MTKKLLFLALTALPVFNPLNATEIEWGGQIRPRFEFRDPAAGGGDDSWTSMRVRTHLKARLERGVQTFIQWQDVRLWGEEANTLGDFSADHLDLHQGYIDLQGLYDLPLDLRLGRQEIALGGQRLVGAVGWTPQARAFDGVRLQTGTGAIELDLLGLRLADSSAPAHLHNAYLAGSYATLPDIGGLEIYLLYNSAGAATDQLTLGLRQAGKTDRFPYRLEAAYQTGQRQGEDVAAYMLGLRAGVPAGKGSLTLWYDYLSGDDNLADGETKVFDTLFATNHKFYGFADYFLNIPLHTQGGGLQDLALKLTWPLAKGQLQAHLHHFSLAVKRQLDSATLGRELDLILSHPYSPQVRCTIGVSFVQADDSWAAIGRLDKDAKFTFFMLDTQF
ncbi:MAG: hypothetical protein GKR89_26555 [Candidatus Latescibacteria bacterium]|nr:hypothetical protein [Candidatus Latescibacterota bacterium]